MKEKIELRLHEEMATEILGDRIGQRLGVARRLDLDLSDPLVSFLAAEEAEARAQGDTIFTHWNIRRSYSAVELTKARLINLVETVMFEPSGEECGTQYDYSLACSICGAGRVQISELILDTKKIPATADIAFSIARDELIVSDRLADVIASQRLTGARLVPARPRVSRGATRDWFQLTFDSQPIVTVAPTGYGISPFWPGERSTCPGGHVAGLNVLSELFIDKASWDGTDWVRTRDLVGTRRGLLAPFPLIVVSQRAWRVLREGAFRGFRPEVAHLV